MSVNDGHPRRKTLKGLSVHQRHYKSRHRAQGSRKGRKDKKIRYLIHEAPGPVIMLEDPS
jgi:hypothetical protein